MRLFLILLCYCAVRAQVPMTINDYAGGPTEGDAWITLTTPSREWILHRLIWCKSLVPNDQHPDSLPHNCVGRNLLRIQLYPAAGGTEETVVTEPPTPSSPEEGEEEATGHRYYVDPRRVGGWDSRHQWIMEMELQRRDGEKTAAATMIEVLRFNAIDALPTTTAATAVAVTPVPTTAHQQDDTSSSIPGTSSSAVEVRIQRPWIGFVIILGVGLCLIGGGVMAYRFGHWRASLQKAGARNPYDWQHNQGAYSDEEERLRQEDLQILSKMNN